jgi:hypothetical protein
MTTYTKCPFQIDRPTRIVNGSRNLWVNRSAIVKLKGFVAIAAVFRTEIQYRMTLSIPTIIMSIQLTAANATLSWEDQRSVHILKQWWTISARGWIRDDFSRKSGLLTSQFNKTDQKIAGGQNESDPPCPTTRAQLVLMC